MKKKIVSVILAMTMTASLLTACGGDKGTNAPASTPAATAPAPAETLAADDTKADTPDTTDAADTTEGDMVSDEVFELLQDNYATLAEYHDAIVEIYNDDQIVANADIEDAMNQAYDIIDQMGEITQDSITEEDAVALNDVMLQLVDVYAAILDEMEITLDTADAAEGEMVSDETFAVLQENYDILTQLYDAVAETYNSDDIAANAEIEDAMNQAYDIIEQMGEITQETITEEDAVALDELMVNIVGLLQSIVDEM